METTQNINYEICSALCAQYGLTYDPSDPTAPHVLSNSDDNLIIWPAGPSGWPYYFPYADFSDSSLPPYIGNPDMLDLYDALPDLDITFTANDDTSSHFVIND